MPSFKITEDVNNPNCLRVHIAGDQLCKVYGWTPEQALYRAEWIVAAILQYVARETHPPDEIAEK